MMMILKDIVFFVLGVYLLVVGYLYYAQRTLMYFPDKKAAEVPYGLQTVTVSTSDGVLLTSWYMPPTSKDKPVLLYFHGNGGKASDRYQKIQTYTKAGYGVLLAEYRGFGGNAGHITEQGLYLDGRAWMHWLMDGKNIPASKIVLYGESLGSGVAVQLATEFSVSGLVLEVPYLSMLDMAKHSYPYVPVNLMLKDRFMNSEKIANINMPLLVMHGGEDEIIPLAQAEALYALAKEPKTFVGFPKGHHTDLYQYGAADSVLTFIGQLDKPAGSE
ncbi:MAG: alpha/beta hydrolase [Alphaproteobacteria bacterium]|nr:alpha/beta hydrolase [Alphaproteobacteria bacterium]